MVDASRARRDVATVLLRDGLVFDASVRLQPDSAIYKAVAENKIASSVLCTRVWYTMPSYSPAKIVTVWLYGVALKDILQGVSIKQVKETRVRSRGKKINANTPLPRKHY